MRELTTPDEVMALKVGSSIRLENGHMIVLSGIRREVSPSAEDIEFLEGLLPFHLLWEPQQDMTVEQTKFPYNKHGVPVSYLMQHMEFSKDGLICIASNDDDDPLGGAL
jgi:hypothetical protein